MLYSAPLARHQGIENTLGLSIIILTSLPFQCQTGIYWVSKKSVVHQQYGGQLLYLQYNSLATECPLVTKCPVATCCWPIWVVSYYGLSIISTSVLTCLTVFKVQSSLISQPGDSLAGQGPSHVRWPSSSSPEHSWTGLKDSTQAIEHSGWNWRDFTNSVWHL